MNEKKLNKKNDKEQISRWFDEDFHLETRTIFIPDEINEYSAKRFHKQMHLFITSDDPINIIMDCLGGDYHHGMGMYDAIKNCKSHVTIRVTGVAMSMGSLLLQAADDRIVSTNSVLMIHYGYTYTGFDHQKTNEKWAEFQKKERPVMENIYLNRIREKIPNYSKKKLQTQLDFDTILKGQDIVDLGLADGVIGDYEK